MEKPTYIKDVPLNITRARDYSIVSVPRVYVNKGGNEERLMRISNTINATCKGVKSWYFDGAIYISCIQWENKKHHGTKHGSKVSPECEKALANAIIKIGNSVMEETD